MHILIIGPDHNIPTAGMIHRGITKLLSTSFPDYTYDFCRLQAGEHQDLGDIEKGRTFYDLIIQTGSILLQYQVWKSYKFNNLRRIFDMFPFTPKLVMGIGSCFKPMISRSDATALMTEGEKDLKRVLMHPTVRIVTRDRLAQEILINLSYKDSMLLPCPAYYNDLAPDRNAKKVPIIIWKDPRTSINTTVIGDRALEYYRKKFTDFLTKFPGSKCYVANDHMSDTSADVMGAIRLGLPVPRILNTTEDSLKLIVSTKGPVISGRVHLAVPFKASGNNVKLVSMDTRAGTLHDWIDRGWGWAEREYISLLGELCGK